MGRLPRLYSLDYLLLLDCILLCLLVLLVLYWFWCVLRVLQITEGKIEKKNPPKKDSLTNSTQSKIRYCPKLLLLYIYLKRLNFKLKVSLISNYPFYKVNLPTSIFAGIKIQVKSSLSSLHWYDLFFHFKKEWKLNSKVSTYLHLLIY